MLLQGLVEWSGGIAHLITPWRQTLLHGGLRVAKDNYIGLSMGQ